MSPVCDLLSQAVVYEKPGFQGSCMEVDSNIFSFSESEAGDSEKPTSVGSLKIIGGMWVFSFFQLFLRHGLQMFFAQSSRTEGYAMLVWTVGLTAALFCSQLGGLQRARVWGTAAHPRGRRILGQQRLGRPRGAKVPAASSVCEYWRLSKWNLAEMSNGVMFQL